MRAKSVLVVLVLVALVLVPDLSKAVPRCDQLNVEINCGGGYTYIKFGQCNEQTGIGQWKCCYLDASQQEVCYPYWWDCWCNDHPGCDCLLEGTTITLADGTTKPVEAIQSGDQVLAYDESTGAMVRSLVLKTHTPLVAPFYFIINEKLRVTENHPLLSKGAWVAAGSLKIGDRLTSAGGQSTPIFALRKVVGKVKVFNFQVAASTYVADGIVVHNKEQCEEYQQWCPDCE